jgi:hypothetical protein
MFYFKYIFVLLLLLNEAMIIFLLEDFALSWRGGSPPPPRDPGWPGVGYVI